MPDDWVPSESPDRATAGPRAPGGRPAAGLSFSITPALRLALLTAQLVAAAAVRDFPDFDAGTLPKFEFPHLEGVRPPPEAPRVHLIGDSKVRVLVGGEEFEVESLGVIHSARNSIDLEMFQFSNDSLIDALETKAREGVSIRVLLSPFPSRFQFLVSGRLRRAGVQVSFYPAGELTGGFYRIDHAKLLVVDGERAVTGGSNWKPEPSRNHDFNLAVSGGLAARLGTLFNHAWARAQGRESERSEHPPGEPIRLLVNEPGNFELREATLGLIRDARKSIAAEQLQLSDPQIIDELARAAGRGVEVRLLLDAKGAFVGGFNRQAAYRLKDSGAQIRLFDGDQPGLERLHAKLAVFDGEATSIGSGNWSRNSMLMSRELSLIVRHEGLAREFTAEFEEDWEFRSRATSPKRSILLGLIGWLLDRTGHNHRQGDEQLKSGAPSGVITTPSLEGRAP